MAEVLSGLAHIGLARLTLSLLWGIQDAGGVSCGRSVRSTLLEAAMDLLPRPNIDISEFTIFDIQGEAGLPSRRRVGIFLEQQLPLPRLDLVSDQDLAMMILGSLRLWYEQDAKISEQPLSVEQNILTTALRLLPPRFGCWSWEDLLKEARDREGVRFEIEADKRDRISWAASRW
ncbi:MAG: hypothetical protein ABR884_00100 [Minisyncoccia bacterium]|jgi:hypothetical protein